MMAFLKRWIITTVGVLVAAWLVPGIHYNVSGLVIATLVLGLLNAVVRPVLVILSLPLLILTLGLFLIIINAFLLYWVGRMKISLFHVDDFFPSAVLGSIIISLVTLVLNTLTRSGDSRMHIHRRNPRRPDGDGDGPVIDV